MAANGELAREDGGRAEGQEDDVDDEATFFSLELTSHQSSTIDGHDEKGRGGGGKQEEGNKGIDDREVVVESAGDAASVAFGIFVGPATRLRTLVRKLLGPGRHPSGGRTPAAVEECRSRFTVRVEVQSPAARRSGARAVAADAEERRMSTEAALKYLSKVPILACRSGVGDEPDDTSPPPPHRPQAPSRADAGLRQLACKRRLGTARSSVPVAALLPPTPPRRDDSLLQAQDGVASAIAYCKLSLTG